LEVYKEKPINFEALFTGGNPFEEADGITSHIHPDDISFN